METAVLKRGRVKPYISTPKSSEKKEVLNYEILQKYKEKYFASGKKSQRIIREFTPEEQRTFDNGYTIDEIFDGLNKKYGFML
jgi:hypothetical protein